MPVLSFGSFSFHIKENEQWYNERSMINECNRWIRNPPAAFCFFLADQKEIKENQTKENEQKYSNLTEKNYLN